jgi:hypothetical protein
MPMRGAVIGAALAVLSVLLVPGQAADDEFVSLFDGKTLAGWTAEHTDRFVVREGVIFNDGGTGWLRSTKSYKDFELRLEYRALKKGGDSGLFLRATAESASQAPNWPVKAYQLQVIDDGGNLQIFGHGTPPPRFDRKTNELKAAMKGAGEWNALTLKVAGHHAEVILNGKTVTVSDAITLPDGHIGLQGENAQFEWRNIKLKVLPAP